MARKIVVTSGKGGVGKTTICAKIGVKLASLGFRVAILDMDIGLNNLDVVMGLEDDIHFDIVDVLNGNCRLKQALVQDEKYPSLYVLASKRSLEEAYINQEELKGLVDSLSQSFDYILIDCPAGVDDGFKRAVCLASEAIVVVTPHISSVRDADKVLSLLAKFDIMSKYLIINRVRGDFEVSMETLGIEEIVRFLKTKLLGVVPEDDSVTRGELAGDMGSLEMDRAISLTVENLHNGTRKIFDVGKKYRGFWGMFRRGLKKKL